MLERTNSFLVYYDIAYRRKLLKGIICHYLAKGFGKCQ